MSFRSDRRGRVPFAVLGALLLLTSSLYATTASTPAVREPVAPEVIDRAQTTARMRMVAAIRDAQREAARRPVLEPADSGVGRLLDSERPFHRYLRLLIAIHARDALRNVSASRAGVTASVSLPPIRSEADAARAIENVSISHVGEAGYRVNVSDLVVNVSRGDRHTDSIRYDVSVVVPMPALRLHDSVREYESRLDAGITKPGLTQDLTTRLWAITWARGYAQYGGAPISNVLANRHVEVMTNDALLTQQSAVFGAADPGARKATRRAATNVAFRDAYHGAKGQLEESMSKKAGEHTREGVSPSVSLPDSFRNTHSFDLDRRVDETFVDFVEGDSRPDLHEVVDDVYRARIRAVADADYRGFEREESGSVPANLTFAHRFTSTSRRLEGGSWEDEDSGRTLRTFDGTVVVERRVTELWVGNSTYATTTETYRRTYDVDIDLRYRYRDPGIAPDRGMSGRPFGDEARSTLTDRAEDELASDTDDLERLAVDAVGGGADTGWTTVDVTPPAAAEVAAYEETADLRRRVRDVDVSLETRSIASAANPASRLAAKLSRRESSLLDAPGRYDTVRERAAIAARLVYLRTLRDRLEGRSPVLHRVQQRLADELQSRAIPAAPPERETELCSSIATAVVAEPTYLSIAARGSEKPAMAARNINVFSVPYGDAADTIASGISTGGPASVSLGTAARTLDSLETLPPQAVNESVRSRRSALRGALRQSLQTARSRYQSKLAAAVGERRSTDAVSDAFRRWETPRARAMAITDGHMAPAIAAEIDGRLESEKLDLLTVKLRVTSHEIRESAAVRIDEDVVDEARTVHQAATSAVVKPAVQTAGKEAAEAGWERATDRSAAGLPAGMPILPVPGSWYATANAWAVSVRGSYERFVIRTPRAAPNRAQNGTVEYVRTDTTIERDVDGDGRSETLGRNRPIDFSVDTGVLVVVPPGGSGVGDVDGNADERSPGW